MARAVQRTTKLASSSGAFPDPGHADGEYRYSAADTQNQ